MKAQDLYRLIGDKTAGDDLVVAIDSNGTTYNVEGITREEDPDSTGPTAFIKISEN